MNFWDSSALVPLLIAEPRTAAAERLLRDDPALVVWALSTTECVSALARKSREKEITSSDLQGALESLRELSGSWHEIQNVDRVRKRAERLLLQHPLRSADALQMAAALVACEDQPHQLGFVTFDDLLADTAVREGFRIVHSGAPS